MAKEGLRMTVDGKVAVGLSREVPRRNDQYGGWLKALHRGD